ncbi:MAG: hypothetical protein LUC93_07875 [Planctomycetaceae bacterium]|nr:hypothetical protein [Planctomycetaceae bacterium]
MNESDATPVEPEKKGRCCGGGKSAGGCGGHEAGHDHGHDHDHHHHGGGCGGHGHGNGGCCGGKPASEE